MGKTTKSVHEAVLIKQQHVVSELLAIRTLVEPSCVMFISGLMSIVDSLQADSSRAVLS
jgi:hypothetical protein